MLRVNLVGLAVLAMLASFALPAVANWEPGGTRVSTAPGALHPTLVPDGFGGVLAAFVDNASALRVQRVTGGGDIATGWPVDGVVACPAAFVARPRLLADGDGGAFVAWTQYKGGPTDWGDVYLQHVTGLGAIAPGWPSAGTAVHATYDTERLDDLVPDGSGGVIYIWTESLQICEADPPGAPCVFYTPPDVWGARYSGSGTLIPGWPKILSSDPAEQSGAQAAWDSTTDTSLLLWSDSRIHGYYALRIDSTGNVASGWPTDGRPVIIFPAGATSFIAAPDRSGGMLVAWCDSRSGTSLDIFAQHVLSDGTLPINWPIGGRAICTAPLYKYDPRIASDGTGGAYAVWRDFRSGYSNGGKIYVQHIDSDGSPASTWPADGLPLAPAPGNQDGQILVADDEGGAIIAWNDRRDGYIQIYAQRRLSDGSLAAGWPDSGLAVTSARSLKSAPAIAFLRPHDAIVAWNDERYVAGGQLFAQRLTTDAVVSVLASCLSADVRAGTARLLWYVPGANRRVTLYRRTSRTDWEARATAMAPHDGQLALEDGLLAAGERYGYRIGITKDAAEEFSSIAWVEVPGAAALSLAALGGNPAPVPFGIEFSLAGDGPAWIEAFDVHGRRLLMRDVGALGAGAHVLRWEETAVLASGVYVVRLRQGEHFVSTRVVVVH